MVDRTLLAIKVAAIRDAVTRIRQLLPATRAEFASDRTAREVVILNLFVALQDCIALATHWLSDAGVAVPETYGQVLAALGDQGVLERDLAARLASALGLRNLIAHRYGAIDGDRIYEIASTQLDDLLAFCEGLARKAQE